MFSIPIPPRSNRFLMQPIILERAFSREECRQIIECLNIPERKLKRDSGDVDSFVVYPIKELSWFFDKVMKIVLRVNSLYNFDITEMSMFSFLRYQNGSYMDWHYDIGEPDEKDFTEVFRTRKITMSILLSDSNSYKGGKLCFQPEINCVQEQGTVIAYPSFVYHSVEPLTEGIREVMLVSINGPVFQ